MFLLIKLTLVVSCVAMTLVSVYFLFKLISSLFVFKAWSDNKDEVKDTVKEARDFFKCWKSVDEVKVEVKDE